jgi:hypothetical protein
MYPHYIFPPRPDHTTSKSANLKIVDVQGSNSEVSSSFPMKTLSSRILE